MRKAGIVTSNLLIAALLASCIPEASKSSIEETGIPVKLQRVVAENVTAPRNYVGTIVESQALSLSFLTAGNVEKVLAIEGQRVEKGQILAVLHCENNRSLLAAAKAKEKQAQDAYDRLSTVYKNGSLPDVKMVEIETGLQQAKSSAEIAAKNLTDCTLYAPTGGIVGRRSIEPGMNVVPENPVMTIVKVERLFARVAIPESEIAHTSVGADGEVEIGALENLVVKGMVAEKGVIADPLTHTYAVKISIDNPQGAISPGMACKVSLTSLASAQRIVVPQCAVLSGGTDKYVFVADTAASRAVKRVVEVGTLCSNGVVILSGLTSGEPLVVEGYQKLTDRSLIVIR